MAYDVNSILDRLCAAFPACFSRSAPKPLKIGLGEELMAGRISFAQAPHYELPRMYAAADVFALGSLGPSTVNLYNNLIPVVSVAASFLFLKELLTPLQLLGGAVDVTGVWLATSVRRAAPQGR